MNEQQDWSQFHKKLNTLIQKESVPLVIENFLKDIKGPYLYLEWFSDPCAFKLTYSRPKISTEWVRLYESEPSFEMDHLESPLKIKILKNLVQQVSPEKDLFPYRIFVKDQLFGLFFLSEKNLFIENLLCYLQLKCESLVWKKQCETRSDYEHFLKILYTEISRSRRLNLPVTLILIDGCASDSKNSSKNLMMFFKSLRNHLAKNSRMYDSIIPLSPTEMAIILPHTSEKGAMEKAEKLYWILNSLNCSKILKAPVHFQISVAEYPKSARDASSFLQIARQACAFRRSEKKPSGICIAQAPEGFKPDFQIQQMEPGSLCELI